MSLQGESIAKPETPLQINISLECKSDIKEAYGNKFDPSFKTNVFGQKHPVYVNKCNDSIPYMLQTQNDYFQNEILHMFLINSLTLACENINNC